MTVINRPFRIRYPSRISANLNDAVLARFGGWKREFAATGRRVRRDTRSVRIGVVGAGIAGLSATKVLRSVGHDIVTFDRTPDVGGVWSRTRHYPGLKTQNTRYTYT